jgi:hypothetical protein
MMIDTMIRQARSKVAAYHGNPEKQSEARKELSRLARCKGLLMGQIGTLKDRKEIEATYAEQAWITGGYSKEFGEWD